MKTAKFTQANFEHIRARVYDAVPQPQRTREEPTAHGLRRAPAMALVLAALAVVCTISVAAATGAIDLGAIYRVVFGASSVPFANEAGGTACESEGIKMEVVSVVADANGIYAVIDMTDLTGKQRLGYHPPEEVSGDYGNYLNYFWNIPFDSLDDVQLKDGRFAGSNMDFSVIDTGEAWPNNHMTAVAFMLTGGEVKRGTKWELRFNRLGIQHADAGQPDIDGEWKLSITVDKLAKVRKLRARYETEEISLITSPISTNITIAFDRGTWRDIFAADPYNIPAVMVLKDGSKVEMTFQGCDGTIQTEPDPTDPTDCYYTTKYSYDLLDTSVIDHIEFDRYVFSFADGGKVMLK